MGASVINFHIRVVMPANRLRVNHYDFMALHSVWRILHWSHMASIVEN